MGPLTALTAFACASEVSTSPDGETIGESPTETPESGEEGTSSSSSSGSTSSSSSSSGSTTTSKTCGGKEVGTSNPAYGCAAASCAPCALDHATAGCASSGACSVASCEKDYGDCDGNAANGCETSTRASLEHCGACGKACGTPNGTATCDEGTCNIACKAGFDPCSDGCCLPSSTVTRLEAGDRVSCYVGPTGGVSCWGKGTSNQLGDGSGANSKTPVTPTGLASGVSTVSVGRYHACAVTTAGGVKCWGSNASGQLGVDGITKSTVPIDVTGLGSGYARVSAGHVFSCALSTVGSVQCWGQNNSGAVGDGTTTNRPTPTQVTGLESGVVSIAAGYEHACAVTSAGGVKCWGGGASATTPADVPGLTAAGPVKSMATGQYQACAVLADGSVKCWKSTRPYAPTAVQGVTGALAVTSDYTHSCAIVAGGVVKCWGSNSSGKLGDGTTTSPPANTAVTVLGLKNVVEVTAGDWHTCAVTNQGVVSCWGSNSEYQLGLGVTASHSASPVVVQGL